MQLNKLKTVAISGLNPSELSDEKTIAKLQKQIKATVKKLFRNKYDTFITSLSDPFDIITAQTILNLKSRLRKPQLIVVIPHQGHRKQFSPDYQELYQQTLNQATQIITIADQYSPAIMLQLNNFLIDNSSILVSYYRLGDKGDARYVYFRAKGKNVPIVNLCV